MKVDKKFYELIRPGDYLQLDADQETLTIRRG
jgi:hypothetical protein